MGTDNTADFCIKIVQLIAFGFKVNFKTEHCPQAVQPMARSSLTASKARRDRAIGAIGATPILLLLYIYIFL